MKHLSILFIFLLIASSCSQKKQDSENLQEEIDTIKTELAKIDSLPQNDVQDEIVKIPLSLEDKQRLDELEEKAKLEYEMVEFLDQEVHYSPDSIFRIYTLLAEDCSGSHCQDFSLSYIYSSHFSKNKTLQSNFVSVQDIHKINKNKYLILEKYEQRASSEDTEITIAATLISLENDSVSYHLIAKTPTKDGTASFRILQSYKHLQAENLTMSLSYDAQTQQLIYIYETIDYANPKSRETKIGRYNWENNTFKFVGEEKQ